MAETFLSSLKAEREAIAGLAKTLDKSGGDNFQRFHDLISDYDEAYDSETDEVSCCSGYLALNSIV